MTSDEAGATVEGDRRDPTDGQDWTDEHGVQWRKRSGIDGKRLRKLLASADVRVLLWNNTTSEIRDVPTDEMDVLREFR
jgi:hypothetical protein